MKDRKLAVRYARALLSVFPDVESADATERFLLGLRDAINASQPFRNFLLDPAFTRDNRKSVFRELVERAGLPRQVGRFMDTLVDNNRSSVIPSIAEMFQEEREAAMGIVPAEIVTASPLGPELTRRAQQTVERLTGRRVRLTCSVDSDLLGGAVTKIGSTVHDGSLRTQLAKLRTRMVQE